MTDELTFTEAKLEAGWLMVKPAREDLGKAMAIVRKMKPKVYVLSVKEFRKKRSLDANAYAWVLIHALAKEMRIDPLEVYQQAVLTVGDNYTPMCVRQQDMDRFVRSWESRGDGWQCVDRGQSSVEGCRTVFAYYGSSVFDTRQMSRLIDSLIQDCKALDIETMTPDKLTLLVEEWK